MAQMAERLANLENSMAGLIGLTRKLRVIDRKISKLNRDMEKLSSNHNKLLPWTLDINDAVYNLATVVARSATEPPRESTLPTKPVDLPQRTNSDMSSILISDTGGDDWLCSGEGEATQLKRPYYGPRGNHIGDEEVTELPPKKLRISFSHLGSLSQLPREILFQIISEITDRRTLLSVCRMEAFQGVLNMGSCEFFRSAYTEEVRRGEYISINAIATITKRIKKHPEAALMIFEVAWKGIIRAGQLKGAVSFLYDLSTGLDSEDFDTVLLSLQIMSNQVVLETSWEAWAAAFTAIDFLHSTYQSDSTKKMVKWIQHEAVLKRQEIMGQDTLKVQWNNAYCVLKKLQSYYELEKHRDGKKHIEWRNVEREEKLNSSLVEVVQATLNLAVQEHQWVEASNQVFELVVLNADIHYLVGILETICSSAISEGLWEEATKIVPVFKAIPDYANVAKESLERLENY
ncbi:hypothetical protein VE02_09056 [Pseudogymnoascus sp. 03VT05]|nr:hypothetical protein VE02_09056 [Pseudogymnoascus sp. 03VT05]